MMPEMSGDLLAAEVKRINPAAPVIMITANADLLPNMLSGVDRILSKPFEFSPARKVVAFDRHFEIRQEFVVLFDESIEPLT